MTPTVDTWTQRHVAESAGHPAAVDGGPLRPGRSVTVEVRPVPPRTGGPGPHSAHAGAIRRAYVTGPPDTFFSVPARVSLDGRKVRGYITAETVVGYTTPTPDDPLVYRFVPYTSS